MKGSFYKLTNNSGESVIVLCTEDPTSAVFFSGVVVETPTRIWHVGEYSDNWNQKWFVPTTFPFKPKTYADLKDSTLAEAYRLLFGQDWRRGASATSLAEEMRSYFGGGCQPCRSFDQWVACIHFLDECLAIANK